MITPSKLTPVSRFVAAFGMLPSSYKEAMTYEEQLVWLCNYLETEILPAINNNADGLAELQNLYVELKDYVDNYFDNLDIQAEVNAKINAMVESGQLEEIITAYLQVKGVLGFDTVADMKAGTNFIDGSIARTLGKTTYNDKEGSFYYIRDLKNTDVIDEVNIIAITNYPDLVAEKIKDKAIEDIESDITAINANIDNIEDNIDEVEATISNNEIKPTIFIGDSYAAITTYTDTWVERLASLLGLTENVNYWKSAQGGAGFIGNNLEFKTLLQNLDATITNKSQIKRIVVAGGLNDGIHGQSVAQLTGKINEFITYAKTNYPNAELYLAFIGWSSAADPANREHTLDAAYMAYANSGRFGFKFLDGTQYVMHNYTLFGDYDDTGDTSHPNNDGMTYLAQAIYNALTVGYASNTFPARSARIGGNSGGYFWNQLVDNKLIVSFGGSIPNTTYTAVSTQTEITADMGDCTSQLWYMRKVNMVSTWSQILQIKYTDNSYSNTEAQFSIDNTNHIIIKFVNPQAKTISTVSAIRELKTLDAMQF